MSSSLQNGASIFFKMLKANGAEGVYLVMNGNLSSCCFVMSSKERRSRNLTLLMELSTDLKE